MSRNMLIRQRGSVITLALLVVVFAALIAVTFGRQVVLGKSMAAKERQLSQAYYAAESGLTEMLLQPDQYIPAANLPLKNTAADNFQTGLLALPGEPDLKIQLEVKWLRTNIYEVRAMGHTPYATALAAAEVTLDDATGVILDTAYHMGGVGVPLAVPGTPGGGGGNANGVNYHFTGSDMAVYGTLDFVRDPGTGEVLQAEETFNIWGGHEFLSWNWLEDEPPIMPDWLLSKTGNLDEDAEFPKFVADYLRAAAIKKVPIVGYGPPAVLTNSQMEIGSGWTTGTPIAGRAQHGGTLSNNIDVEGLGYLRLDNAAPVIIDKLTMHGDLTIITKGDIQIASINGGQTTQIHDTGGFRLNIISDGSIKLGPSSSTYDPYPYFAQARNDCFFLGDGSVLWAQNSLVISGQVRSGRPSDYPLEQANDFDPEENPIIEWDSGAGTIKDSPDPLGSLVLVAKGSGTPNQHSLTLHTFDSAGIVYAGDRIKAFRIRLHGPAFVTNPYQTRKIGKEDVVGLAELNLISHGNVIFDDLDLGTVYATVVRRLK